MPMPGRIDCRLKFVIKKQSRVPIFYLVLQPRPLSIESFLWVLTSVYSIKLSFDSYSSLCCAYSVTF
jgi:hypothetical protein